MPLASTHLLTTSPPPEDLLWHPQARMDLVRAGIGLYGLSPDPSVATGAELGLRPAMRLESPLVQVKRIEAGQAVSYGGPGAPPLIAGWGSCPWATPTASRAPPAPPVPWESAAS